MRVLVTGASGFLGKAMCKRLLAEDHDVLALVRRPGSEPPGTTAVPGDLTNSATLAQSVAQITPDAVVHLAAEIASQRSEEKVRRVNVDGMRTLVDALREHGEPRVVFASTVVTGDAGGRVLTEDEPLPVTTPYGRSKQDGERMLAESGLPVVSALLFALEDAPSGETYHCVDDEPIAYYDFMSLTASTLGLGAPRRIPAALARLAAGSNAVDALVRSARSSNAKLKAAGWTMRYPTARAGVPEALRALS